MKYLVIHIKQSLFFLIIISLILPGSAISQDHQSPSFGISVPYVNSFHVYKPNIRGSSVGFWGLALQFELPLAQNTSVSSQVGTATDLMFPIPVGVDRRGEYDDFSALYMNLRYNVYYGRFSYGIGFHISSLAWRHVDWSYAYVHRNNGGGISLMGQFYFQPLGFALKLSANDFHLKW